jgi:hypothetical protein
MLTHAQHTYQVVGFDRVQFVSDLTEAIPQDGRYQLAGLQFECDGVRAMGSLTIQVENSRLLSGLDERFRAVRGVVSVRQQHE